MIRTVKVFISYRRVSPSEEMATKLANDLKNIGYEVYMDVMVIRGGSIWEQEIFQNINTSDVVLVLLQPETAKSEWVQREVDVARGAHVSILPLRLQDIDVKDVQEKLAISGTQFLPYTGRHEDYPQILESIEILYKRTRSEQRYWIKQLEDKWRVQSQAPTNQNYSVFSTKDGDACKIHLATGDILEMKDIEVVVNSENDYMQMARIYDNATLSSVLRRAGAHITGAGIRDDTVQKEIEEQIAFSSEFGSRPIRMGTVIVTHGGHELSDLVRSGVRYIFHCATVHVDPNFRERIMPMDDDASITRAVINCLDKVLEVDKQGGMVFPANTESGAREARLPKPHVPIKSIIFPVFGTGEGGLSVAEVAPAMIRAFKRFLRENKSITLEKIYLSVFSERDISAVEEMLDHEFNRES